MPSSVIAYVAANAAVALLPAGVSLFVSLAVRVVVSVVVGSLVRSILGSNKPKALEQAPPSVDAASRTATIKQPISPWQIIYGQARVGGVITYVEVTGQNLHLVITLAGHVCEEIGNVYFNDELIPVDGLGAGGGGAITGRLAGYGYIEKSTGSSATQPFPNLQSESAGLWTANHIQRGRAAIHVNLTANRDLYPSGIPNITVVVKGKKDIYDPRTTLSGYSSNAALCVADYITSDIGFGADYSTEINEDQLIAAANSCDEAVSLAAGGSEVRYALNGAFPLDRVPKDILGLLLGAMSGKAVNVGGEWNIFAGVYEVPVDTFDEDDLIGSIKIQSMVSRRDNCNGVKGLFTDPNSFWQPTSFPAVASTTYLNEDGGTRVWRDIDLSGFVTSGTQAQRIAKIELLSTRQGLSIVAPFRLAVWAAMTGRTLALSNERFGWSAKPFEIGKTRFITNSDGTIGVELTLRETAAAVFDWSTSEEQDVDIAPNSTLPSPFDGMDVSGLTATSGTADLLLQGDGTVVPRIHLRWSQPSSPFLKGYEVEFALASGSPQDWVPAPQANGSALEAFAFPVKDGVSYDCRVRAFTTMGNRGDWAYVLGHTVVGKTAVPSDVASLSVAQQGSLVLFIASKVSDADLYGIELRYGETTNTWEDAAIVGYILRGEEMTTASIPPGTWKFFAKAVDTSGNYSTNDASATLTVSNAYSIIREIAYAGGWNGSLVNLVRHYTGVVTLDSQSLASDVDWEVFDQFVYNPYATGYFESPEYDKAIDSAARIWGDAVSLLGPGEVSGSAQVVISIDLSGAYESYGSFEDWSIGVKTFRYIKTRMTITAAVGNVVVSAYTLTIDAEERVERGQSVAVDAAGTAIVFTTEFHDVPNLQVTNVGSTPRIAGHQDLTATGATLRTFDTAGAGAAGTVDWVATGP